MKFKSGDTIRNASGVYTVINTDLRDMITCSFKSDNGKNDLEKVILEAKYLAKIQKFIKQ